MILYNFNKNFPINTRKNPYFSEKYYDFKDNLLFSEILAKITVVWQKKPFLPEAQLH